MNLVLSRYCWCSLLLLLICCLPFAPNAQTTPKSTLGHGYEFEGNGKDTAAPVLSQLYTKSDQAAALDSAMAQASPDLLASLKNQYRYLFLKDPGQGYRLENLSVSNEKLRKTLQELISKIEGADTGAPQVSLYQIKGEDGRGNVHFTAYFTPVMEASKTPDDIYKYPIYRKPLEAAGQKLPKRSEIDGQGALKGLGLEVLWTTSLLENYFLQVQGSGYASLPDGSLQFLAFNGQNDHPYQSLGKYLISQGHISEADISLESIRAWFVQHPDSLETMLFRNESYTFLAPSADGPKGAYGFDVTPGHSIAVDTQFIPLGAVLLGRVPVLDDSGKLLRHDYTILTAQDKGGAIKGPGHVDLYMGVGTEALKKASAMHHYGNLWLVVAD